MLLPRAPDPSRLRIVLDDDVGGISVRVQCGQWPATLTWREPAFHVDGDREGLYIVKAAEPRKQFSVQLAIENVTQATARNGLCRGLIELQKRGFNQILHVHDEIMLIVPRRREDVLRARGHMLELFGARNIHPMGWAMVMNPDEIRVTQSLYEGPPDLKLGAVVDLLGDRWGRTNGTTATAWTGSCEAWGEDRSF